jgi:hypothetical protein
MASSDVDQSIHWKTNLFCVLNLIQMWTAYAVESVKHTVSSSSCRDCDEFTFHNISQFTWKCNDEAYAFV